MDERVSPASPFPHFLVGDLFMLYHFRHRRRLRFLQDQRGCCGDEKWQVAAVIAIVTAHQRCNTLAGQECEANTSVEGLQMYSTVSNEGL